MKIIQNNKILFVYTFTIIFCFFTLTNLTFAHTPIVPGAKPDCDCTRNPDANDCHDYCTGDYKLNDILGIAVTYINNITAIIGSIVLLFLVYGGVLFVISAGNQETVTRAKRVIIGSIIGLIIVFSSYTIIYFTAGLFGVDRPERIFDSSWFQ